LIPYLKCQQPLCNIGAFAESPKGMNVNAFQRVFSIYHGWTVKAPYITNCTTGFVIAVVGDLICQRYFEYPARKERIFRENQQNLLQSNLAPGDSLASSSTHDQFSSFQWDFHRSMQMGLIRAFVVTPFVMFWYRFLFVLSPGTSFLRTVTRVIIDQSISSPIVISLVFTSKAVLNRQSVSHWFSQLKEQFFTTWITGLRYWPIVHMLTFSIIPSVYRPVWSHFASVYWNAILSYYSNIPPDSEFSSLDAAGDHPKKASAILSADSEDPSVSCMIMSPGAEEIPRKKEK
jgi:hypothetical protein